MLDSFFSRAFSPLVDGIAATLARRDVSATAVSIAGFVAGIAAIVFLVSGFFFIAFLLLALNRLLDGIDGAVARRTQPTKTGEFLDFLFDYIVIGAVPFAFAAENPVNALAATFLLLALLAWAVTDMALRLTQERPDTSAYDLGAPQLPNSLCGIGETFIVFAIMCFVPWLFSVLCYLYGILLFVSVGVLVATVLMSSENRA